MDRQSRIPDDYDCESDGDALGAVLALMPFGLLSWALICWGIWEVVR